MATKSKPRDDNRDPLSGEPGAHPLGAGIGAAVGGGVAGGTIGAVAAGAAAGTAAGPVGAAIGAVAGGLLGGLAGKEIAESIDPTAETEYWRQNFKNRAYASGSYEDYEPAYRYGWESRARYHDRNYDEVQADLERDWQQTQPRLHWDKAEHAVRDAWDRIEGRRADRRRPQKG